MYGECEIGDLTAQDYELIRKLVYRNSGINLGTQKMQLVRARLGKLIRTGGHASFREYYRHVEQDTSGAALCTLLDAIATNTTHLFREIGHFDLLRDVVSGWAGDAAWRAGNPALRIWSAACSSGEEPYSIAMVAHAALQNRAGIDLKILATDLSTRVLQRAQAGVFEAHRVGTVPDEYKRRYLERVTQGDNPQVRVKEELRRTITFARLNLMDATFPFRHGFHVIFCRNVMIYFDRETQQTLVQKLARHLRPGGYLIIGHSESLSNIDHDLKYVQPTVYRQES